MKLRARHAAPATGPVRDALDVRTTELLPGMALRRALPHRDRPFVGPWVFLDHFGPTPDDAPAMDVPPHPHIGLQTVTWVVEGEMLHLDSLGSRQPIRPGQLNWMTAGRGIAHAELAPAGRRHGVQLWVALPEGARDVAPAFEHHAALPRLAHGPVDVIVVAGAHAGHTSPATTHSPLVALDLRPHGAAALPLDPAFEHAVVTLDGVVDVDGHGLAPGTLLYLGTGRSSLAVGGSGHALLIGGAPLGEDMLLWWNFVARTDAEIRAATAAWAERTLAGPVPGHEGPRLEAPPLP